MGRGDGRGHHRSRDRPAVPLLITEAGRRSPAGVAVATARVSVVGYGAYLGGPPVVGFLAGHVGLRIAFVCVALACAGVLVAMSRTLRAVHKNATPARTGYR